MALLSFRTAEVVSARQTDGGAVRVARALVVVGAMMAACGSTVAQTAPANLAPPAEQPSNAGTPAAYEDPREEHETEIILKDRRRVSGKLVEVTSESVVLSISGIPTVFKLDGIEGIHPLPTVTERFNDLRAAIADDDIEGLLRLAEWARSKGRLIPALQVLEGILKQEPANRAALDLKTIIVEQQKVNAAKPAPTNTQRPGTKPGPAQGTTPAVNPEPDPKTDPSAPKTGTPGTDDAEPEPTPGKTPKTLAGAFPLLTDEQINTVRVFEVDFADPPAMVVKRDTVTRFLDKYEGTIVEGRGIVPVSPEARDQFYRLRPAQALSWFFDVRAREFYPEVQVLENPRSMRVFRDTVNRTWLVNSCATSKCHGGEDAGRYYLYNKNQASDRAAYTNWVITDMFRTADGLPMIDLKDPARSPLLQMGLPRDKAIIKHPVVEGQGRRWVPIFDGPDDRRFRQALDWIQMLYPNRSGYPISYTPPIPKNLRGVPTAVPGAEKPPAPPR